MTILDKLKKYFDETPREQVLKDWEEIKEATKDVDSPTIEQFLLYGVSQQRELLVAFAEWILSSEEDITIEMIEKDVDTFLATNCG